MERSKRTAVRFLGYGDGIAGKRDFQGSLSTDGV